MPPGCGSRPEGINGATPVTDWRRAGHWDSEPAARSKNEREIPMKRRISIAAASSLGALRLVACGGSGDEDTTTEATVSPDTTTEATVPRTSRCRRNTPRRWCGRSDGTPTPGHRASPPRRATGIWASQCATQISPVSAAFQESFADATVENIKYKGIEQVGGPAGSIYLAAVTYSNGVVVVFGGGRPEVEYPAGSCPGGIGDCTWAPAEPDKNRRFIQAARTSAAGLRE